MTHTMRTMTSRERWLAAVDSLEVDRLPFWPKLDGAYPPAQTGQFAGWSNGRCHQYIGSDQQEWLNDCLRYVRPHTDYREQRDGNVRRHTYITPHRTLEQEYVFDQPSRAWHPTRFPVQSVDDIEAMTEWYLDGRAELDADELAQARRLAAECGQRAALSTALGESALMLWVEHLAGVENAHYLLADYPQQTSVLFEAIQRDLARRIEIAAAHHPADLLYLIENTSTTLISVDQYRRHDLPHLKQLGDIARDAGRRLVLHMCGHLKALLDELNTLPVAAFEAFTAPPLGATTLLDGRTRCPTKALIGGTHAMLWLEPAEKIIAFIEQRLDELPHHRGLAVTSSGVMPPLCPPDRIKAVCDWVHNYPVRM